MKKLLLTVTGSSVINAAGAQSSPKISKPVEVGSTLMYSSKH